VLCQFSGEVLLFLFLLLLMMLLLMMMMMNYFLGAGTYCRIVDFVAFTLTFVITDAT